MTNVEVGTFGPAVAVSDLTDMTVACLKEWLPTYVNQLEAEREMEPGTLPSYGIFPAVTLRELTDHPPPAILVMCSGTDGEPLKHPDWTYDATLKCMVHAVTRGRVSYESHRNASLLELSVRRAMLQQHPVGAARIRLRGFDVVPLPEQSSEGRYLSDGTNTFDLMVDQVVQGGSAGPKVPDSIYVEGAEVSTEPTITVNAVGPGGTVS
jgi:hypothetical protein